jgi:hypothetical protein
MDMDILSGDDVDLFDAIPFPLLDDDLTLNTKYLEYKNSDSEEDAISDDWNDIIREVWHFNSLFIYILVLYSNLPFRFILYI